MSQCATCRYWEPLFNGHRGECRIHPPVVIYSTYEGGAATCWPETQGDAWCGEWERCVEAQPVSSNAA